MLGGARYCSSNGSLVHRYRNTLDYDLIGEYQVFQVRKEPQP
jgi:hypothetical protein